MHLDPTAYFRLTAPNSLGTSASGAEFATSTGDVLGVACFGAGIFRNPSEVARHVSTPALILGAWLVGGLIALAGAFVYAELAARRPAVGGQYAYLRDAYHPLVAFLYGWTLLLVVQTGGMAGAAIICGRYFRELTGVAVPEQVIAGLVLGRHDP